MQNEWYQLNTKNTRNLKHMLLLLTSVCLAIILPAQGIYQLWGVTDYGNADDGGVLYTTRYDGQGQQIKKQFRATAAGRAANFAAPVWYNNRFYFAMNSGGLFNRGFVASFQPGNNTYLKLADFHTADIAEPVGSMVLANQKFYGVASVSAASNRSYIYEFDPATQQITVHHHFVQATGRSIEESLELHNGKLYGITQSGGNHNDGVIFEFDPDTKIYTVVKHLNSAEMSGTRHISLLSHGGLLWGISLDFPAYSLFSFDPATAILQKRASLSSLDFSYFSGKLSGSGNMLYGVGTANDNDGHGGIFSFNITNGQLQKIYNFFITTARNRSNLLVHNNQLYGNSFSGGIDDGMGVLFRFQLGTNTYQTLMSHGEVNGAVGNSALALHNNSLYGFTTWKGPNGYGSLFEYNLQTQQFSNRLSFGFGNYRRPSGFLMYENNKVYGVAMQGGPKQNGGIYTWDTETNTYEEQVEMPENFGNLGGSGLVNVNNRYFGLSTTGGNFNYGTLFEYLPNTQTIEVRHHFNQPSGSNPRGLLTAYNGKLYGTCRTGSAHDNGNVFEYDIATNTYAQKIMFTNAWGIAPNGNLLLHNNIMYGTCQRGGTNSGGTLFAFNPLINGFEKLHDFVDKTPVSALMLHGDQLIGTTRKGGASNQGTIYAYHLTTKDVTTISSFNTGSYDFIDQYYSVPVLQYNQLIGTAQTGVGNTPSQFGGFVYRANLATGQMVTPVEFTGLNGRLPNSGALLPVPAPASPGSSGQCINIPGALITESNAQEWVPFTDEVGNAVAEINANGNVLGRVTLSLYVHKGEVRTDGEGRYYLSRNITIETENEPQTPVSIRLYIKKSELAELMNIPQALVAGPQDLSVYKADSPCSEEIQGIALPLQATHSTWGYDYVYETSVERFSTFYFAAGSYGLLPVKITFFTGQQLPQGNRLQWQTASTGPLLYEVERSHNGVDFKKLAALRGEGGHTSTYLDNTDRNRRWWYRIKVAEAGGAYIYSSVLALGANDGTEQPQVQLWPNQVEGSQLQLKINMPTQTACTLRIVDVYGRQRQASTTLLPTGASVHTLQVGHLSPGIYWLQLSEGQHTITQKFLKR